MESSKDILYLVLAFCALWFTFFVCWALWYVITMLRDASRMVDEIRDKLHAIDQAIRGVREKLEHAAGYMGVVAAGTKALMAFLEKRKEKMKGKADQVAQEVKKKMRKMKEKIEEELEG